MVRAATARAQLDPGPASPPETLRQRKRRETLKRIERAALALFIERGFERTSIDMIAERAGISRRTFFYYFSTKDDIIHPERAEAESILAATWNVRPESSPMEAAESILLHVVDDFGNEESVVVDRVTRATPALMERRHYHYACRERALLSALQSLWPDGSEAGMLQVVAAAAIAVLRVAVDEWSQFGGERELPPFVHKGFDELREALAVESPAKSRT